MTWLARAFSILSGCTTSTLPAWGPSGSGALRGGLASGISSSSSSAASSLSALGFSGLAEATGVMLTLSGSTRSGPASSSSGPSCGVSTATGTDFDTGLAVSFGCGTDITAPTTSCCLRRSSAAATSRRRCSSAALRAAALRSAFQAPKPSRISAIQEESVAFGSSARAPSRQKP